MSDGLRHCGVPLGGLGTGSVELRSDGFFHEWQIMNNAPWGAGAAVELPPDTAYFGMQVDERSCPARPHHRLLPQPERPLSPALPGAR